MLTLALSFWVAACLALAWLLLRRCRYPYSVYAVLCCSALMLLGVFEMFPLLRDILRS